MLLGSPEQLKLIKFSELSRRIAHAHLYPTIGTIAALEALLELMPGQICRQKGPKQNQTKPSRSEANPRAMSELLLLKSKR